jgi:hypothetical protein
MKNITLAANRGDSRYYPTTGVTMFFVLETAFGSGLFYQDSRTTQFKMLKKTKNLNEATLFKAVVVDNELKIHVAGGQEYVSLPAGEWTPRSVSMQLQ